MKADPGHHGKCSGHRTPNLPEVVNLNAIVSILATISSSSLLFSVSAAMGQAKWDWISEQPRLLRDLELLDEASRGPLGSFEMLFHPTVLSVSTLGSVATLLNLAVGPFVQQLIDIRTAPVPIASDQVWTPIMSFPSRYLNARSSEIIDAYNSGIWTDASIYSRWAQCPTGNCTWPAFTSLNWCVKTSTYNTSDLDRVEINCPVGIAKTVLMKFYRILQRTESQPRIRHLVKSTLKRTRHLWHTPSYFRFKAALALLLQIQPAESLHLKPHSLWS